MVSVQLVVLVALCLSGLYVFILMVRKMLPEKRHQYTGGLDDQGRYSGPGKLVALNGDTYTGDFHNGTFHGHGSYVFHRGGGSYMGEFREGLFAGQGKEVYPDGSKYVGGFDNSKRSGLGSMTYANGAVFTGHWKNGKKEGAGVFKYSDGTRFDGRFIDGKREGVGFIYDKKNRKLQGKWKAGKLVNGGKLTRVLHKTGTPDPLVQADREAGGGAGEAGEGHEQDGSTEEDDADLRRSRGGTPSRLRLRGSAANQTLSSASSSSSHQHHHKPLSATREKELTNQLLNFSKKQLTSQSTFGGGGGGSSAMSSSTAGELQQERERSALIAELARAHGSGSKGSFSVATTTSGSSSSSTSTRSPALTPGRPPSAGGRKEREQVLSALEDGSSGMESETRAHGDGGGGLSESESDKHAEYREDDPTHVSNRPTPVPSSNLTSPAMTGRGVSSPNGRNNHQQSASPRNNRNAHSQQQASSTPEQRRREYLSSGSEKEQLREEVRGRAGLLTSESEKDEHETPSGKQRDGGVEKPTTLTNGVPALAAASPLTPQKARAKSAEEESSPEAAQTLQRPHSSPSKKVVTP